MKVRVLTESGCGLTKQEAQALGIDFLPLQVQIEDKTYLDGVNLTVEELNSFLERGFMPQTSMPPLGDIEALLESYKNNGITDVILITLSNGLSGTNQAIQASGKWHGVKNSYIRYIYYFRSGKIFGVISSKISWTRNTPRRNHFTFKRQRRSFTWFF